MHAFWLSVLGSAVVAMVYGLFVAQREEQIRTYLAHATGGILRWLYVRALIQAVRGEASIADSRHLAMLITLVFLTFAVLQQDKVQSLQQDFDGVQDRLNQIAQDRAHPPDESELERRIDDDYRSAVRRSDGLRDSVARAVLVGRTISGLFFGASAIAWFAWLPYVQLRQRFAHEIARFSLRIQGMASQDELARLTAAELAVRNPEALRAYVAIMKDIATRNGLPELTKTFELWPSQSSTV